MAFLGRDLVALIQATLESESRKAQQSIREEFEKPAGELLKQFGLESRAHEVFDLLRRYEAKFPTRETGINREKALTEDFMSWGVPSWESANQLADKLHDMYKGETRTKFLNTRSVTAHVGAVLRPFKRRYLDGWADAGVNSFNLEETIAEVGRLNSMVISTDSELLAWSKLTYDLFFKVAVLRDETYKPGISTDQRPRRPLGMIGASSERTYRQQWNAWIDENLKSLLSQSSSMGSYEAPGFSQAAGGFNQGPRDSVYDEFQYSVTPLQSTPAVTSTPSGLGAVLIRITDVNESSLTAERSWGDRNSAARELAPWIQNLVMFWGEGRTASIQLEFTGATGDSKFTLPATALEATSERIISVLNSYV